MKEENDEKFAPITESYLRNSILTSYSVSTLRLFKVLRPEQWNAHFADVDLDALERSRISRPKLSIMK